MDLGLEDRRKEETAAAWGHGGSRRLRGRGWRGVREARDGGGGQGGARTGRPRRDRGVFIYYAWVHSIYRMHQVHFSAAVYCIYILHLGAFNIENAPRPNLCARSTWSEPTAPPRPNRRAGPDNFSLHQDQQLRSLFCLTNFWT
jgi:hypothetical protein